MPSCSHFLLLMLISAPPLAAQTRGRAQVPAATVEESLPQPGNVLILVADDLGVDQLAAYGLGTDLPPTPNLDRMAAAGVVFRNAWSQPTCSPTRAALQTGRHGFRTSIGEAVNPFVDTVGLPLAEVTLPEMLDLGTGGRYAHALIGKWHLTPYASGDLAPNHAGWGHFAGSLEGQLYNYIHWRKVEDGVVSTSSRYATSACVDDALAWIRAQRSRWLCVVAFQAPHAPFHAPPAALHSQHLPSGVPPAWCGNGTTDPRPFYKAMVEALDTEIGRLIAQLPAGELARTTVFFLGDNGTESCVTRPPFPSQAKGTLYEGGVHVPLIAAGYRVEARGACEALVGTADLFATVAELAGVDLGSTLPGVTLDSRSFAPCLADPLARGREWLYTETFSPNGPGNPSPLPACPTSPVCQQDLGFDGPGSVVLTSCGNPLYGVYGSNNVPWRVSGGPPNAPAWLRIGTYSPAFDAALGAWLVSNPPAVVLPYTLGASGGLSATVWTGGLSSEAHYQVVVQDPAQPLGFSVSNALRMDLLWTDMQAAREQRYKVIRFHPCKEELYDLAADPFERTNLLARALTADELAAYQRLSTVIDTMR